MKRLQKYLSGCLAAAMVCGTAIPPAGALSAREGTETPAVYAAAGAGAFTDLDGHWAREKIGRWVDYGLMSGVSHDRFSPDTSLSRAQLFAVMNRLQNNTEMADISMFTDVKPGAWYYDDIAKAVAAGIASGSNGKMRPEDPISRQEVAVVFTRALGVDTSSATGLEQFSDGEQIADWAQGAVSAAVANGFLNGYSNGGFGGGNFMSRAEIVAMLDSSFSGYYDSTGTLRGSLHGNVYVGVSGVSIEGAVGGTLFVAPSLASGVEVNGETVSKTTVSAALPKPVEEEKPVKQPTKEPEKEKPSNKDDKEPTIWGGTGGGSTHKPSKPAPVTDSPDREAIVKQMTNITDGFSVKDVPYEVRTSHPDHFETASHPFSSMYCSVGNIPALICEYYQESPEEGVSNTAPTNASVAAKKPGTYSEKEIFMTGKANVYDLHPNGVNVPIIKRKDADYTTRLLIHYPTDASAFSGRIYVDILNASSGVDLEDMFRRSYENMIRSGDIYIGLTSKASTAQALKNFNPKRYADLDWCVNNADKNKDWTAKENAGTFENGLVWDMLSQLGTVLKEQPEKLFDADLAAKIKSEGRSYLMGQSQSHFYLNTYLDVFYPYVNDILDGKDIWDGYLGAVGGKATTEVSTGVKATASPDFTETDEPYIAVMSGFETAMRLAGPTSGWYYNVPTSEMNRLYEVTSAPHACPTSAILPNNYGIAAAKPDGTSRNLKSYTGDHVEGDVHLDQFITGALVNLDLWAREGTPAPANAVMSSGKDAWGNQQDGLRSPKIEAPVAQYFDAVVGTDLSKRGTEGSMVYFTDAEITAAYKGGYSEYKEKFKAAADKLLADKYVIQEDYDAWMEDCAENEAKVFDAADSVKVSLMNDVTLVDKTPADMETMFNSTAMSISAKYADAWDKVAPEWAKSFELVGDDGNYIQLQESMVLDGETPIVYEEKEIFVKGDASLYALAPDNDIRVKESGLPYTNRIIVRTPKDASQFTGKVWIDNLNATDKFDSEALWRRAGAMIMNNGDAYIGVSSKPLTIKTLQIFGEQVKRADYDELSWASPNTYIFSNFTKTTTDKEGNVVDNLEAHINGTYRDTEIINTDIGFLWDILAQTGYAAKNPANWQTLFNLDSSSGKTINTYLFGQSQSGFNATTFGLFQQLLEEQNAKLPYDGIMTMVGTLFPARSLNQSDKNAPKTDGLSINMGNFGVMNYYIPELKTPFFFAAGENDMNPQLFKQVVSSGKYPKVAYFEMAGVPHSDNNTPSFPTNDILSAAVSGGKSGAESSMNYLAFDAKTETYSVKPGGSDINANMFVRGLLTKLDQAANGGAMPASQFIQTTTTDTANAIGGLQSPQVSVPLNIYKKNGTMTPISNVDYTADAYKAAFTAKLNELQTAGWILPIDVQYMTAYADRMAKKVNVTASMKSIPTVKEIPYDAGIDYHDGVINKSHAFNSMYCSNGKETKYDEDPQPVRLDDYDFEEHEFFLSGTASTYNYDKAQKELSVDASDIDYTTRVLVRYPDKNHAKGFNGTVVIDLLNITAGYDNEDLWRRSYKHLMEEGYGYVGLTYSYKGVDALKRFDESRYGKLKWYDPDGEDPNHYKDGICYDLISQLGMLLRSEAGAEMLGGNRPKQVILTAQSSSAYCLNAYLNAFYPYVDNINGGKDIFDGYLNIVGCATGLAINNPGLSEGNPNTFAGKFAETNEPFVAIMSEYEAMMSPAVPFGYPRAEETDTFRLYEVAGTPHSDPMAPILPNFDELSKAKGAEVKDKEYAQDEVESELQLDQVVSGAIDNLVKWIKNPAFNMPRGADYRMEFTAGSGMMNTAERDAYGNIKGGIRMPQIEAPLAAFKAFASPSFMNTHGSMVYLGWNQLVELYGRGADANDATVDALFKQYKQDFAEAAEALYDDGFICEADKDSLIEWSEAQKPVFEAAKTAYSGVAPAMEELEDEEPEEEEDPADEIVNPDKSGNTVDTDKTDGANQEDDVNDGDDGDDDGDDDDPNDGSEKPNEPAPAPSGDSEPEIPFAPQNEAA